MGSREITRPTRTRNPPMTYTPSVTRSHGNKHMSYRLNAKKALDKKIDATDRDHSCDMEFKDGTLVITCNAGAYEILKSSIYKYYDQSEDRTYRLHTKTSKSSLPDVSKQPMIVEESLSVKNRDPSLSSRQLFRINMFNTTCRIDANGYMVQTFIQEDLDKICEELLVNKSSSELNNKIKQMCKLTKDQINNPKKGQAKSILSAKPILNKTVQTNTSTGNSDKDKKTCVIKQHSHHIVQTQVELNDYNQDSHNHQPKTTHRLMTTNDKELCDSSPTRINSHYNSITSLNDELIDSELHTLSREGEETTDEICIVCGSAIIDENNVECTICGQWLHTVCEGISENSLNNHTAYVCSSCRILDDTIPYDESLHNEMIQQRDETHPKQLVYETKSQQDTDAIKICHTTEAEAEKSDPCLPVLPESAVKEDLTKNNIHIPPIEVKTKPKRAKKKDNLEQTHLELQLAESQTKISNLQTVNQEYRQTIDLLSSKLGIQSPLDNNSQLPFNQQIHQLELKFEGQINKMKLEFEHQLNIISIQMKHNTEINELKCKLHHMENECNQHKSTISGNQQPPSQYPQMNTQFTPFPRCQNGNSNQQTQQPLNHPHTPGLQWTRPPIWTKPPQYQAPIGQDRPQNENFPQQALNNPQIPGVQYTRPPMWTRPQPYQTPMGLVFAPYAPHVQQQKTHISYDTRPKNVQPPRQRVNTETQGQKRSRMQRNHQKLAKTTNTNSEQVYKQQTLHQVQENQEPNQNSHQNLVQTPESNQANTQIRDGHVYTKHDMDTSHSTCKPDIPPSRSTLHHRSISEPALNNEQINSNKPFLGAGRASSVNWTINHMNL